ncbi:hypothetical protein SAMN05192533_106153 [Mesobacillus persicus]|uniref:CAAX prenyl protease 2/Lysostaphin resistance protein A-like domain-containing protein n=1 Tax=Mesobacillus persicus TaxID=930146 RepID=A0A1H8BT52_9BACI|nr:CPBP family intramembrane glutamic endopeptidase [Mesobacillus persicus]SEM86050.1 hypothetical protein SAMN05192533_106153 [Mesobacillus persicus]
MKLNEYRDLIKGLTDKELLFHLYLTQLILLIISIILGLIFMDSTSEFLRLFDWADPLVWKVGISVGCLIVLIDLILMRLLPTSTYDDGGLNERMFQNRNIVHIAVIAAFVAFSEEVLFRGIIQTEFGIIVSSVIFALVHYRYLFNWFLFCNIILLSFVIGFIYMKTGNLAVTITMHFVIDFLLGLSIRVRKNRPLGRRDVE